MGRVEVLARLGLGSAGSFSPGPCVGTCLVEAFRFGTGGEVVVFRAMCFFLGLGLAGGTRVEPYSAGASPGSLIGELSVEEPVSSIRKAPVQTV